MTKSASTAVEQTNGMIASDFTNRPDVGDWCGFNNQGIVYMFCRKFVHYALKCASNYGISTHYNPNANIFYLYLNYCLA